MKHFFYPLENLRFNSGGPLDKYISLLKKNEAKTIYKVIYDMVDYIYAKRFSSNSSNSNADNGDKELQDMLDSNSQLNEHFKRLLNEEGISDDFLNKMKRNEKKVGSDRRIVAFKMLYDFVESYNNKNLLDVNSLEIVLYYLT